MAARKPDPHRLDVAALAAEQASVHGHSAADALPRWYEMQTPPAGTPPPPVQWTARGEQRRRAAEPPQTWLHLQVSAQAWPTCQRCLQPFSAPIEVDRVFRFVDDERQAEALDPDSDDDVLALSPSFDLIALVEDELLLAWPLVPRHPDCSQPGHRAGDDSAGSGPFAALAAWKGRPPQA